MYIEQHSRYQNKANIQLRDDKQFHTVIKDVLLWIEHNLDQSLL
ncbi:hypothetical protein ECZU23_53480 [Escherichia coli]|nr:hypothetical protein ECZU23_53480 [Escherichia coli]